MRHPAIVDWSSLRLTVGGSTYGLSAVGSGFESGQPGESRPVVSAFLALDKSLVPYPERGMRPRRASTEETLGKNNFSHGMPGVVSPIPQALKLE